MKKLVLALCLLGSMAGCYESYAEPTVIEPSVVYANGAYGYYYPCENDYNTQCWYAAPPGYIYGRPIIWGPHYYHPGYRGGYRGSYRGGYGGRGGGFRGGRGGGGGHGGHR